MNTTLKNMAYVLTAISFSKILGAISSLILPKILSPDNYGVWALLIIILSYTPIAALGTVETLVRQYPYFKGKSDFKSASDIENTVFASIILGSVLILLFFGLTFIIETPSKNYIVQVRIMLIVGMVSLYSAFFYYRFAAYQNFKYYSIIDSLRAVVTLMLVTILCWYWGLIGGVIALLVGEISICLFSAYISTRSCGSIKTNFDMKKIWKAIKIGFPITIVMWSLSFNSSLDRIVSGTLLGKTATGYYALSLSIVYSILLVPGAINRVLYPKINEALGKNVDNDSLSEIVIKPIRLLCIIMPVIIGLLMFVLPKAYVFFFNNYLPGLQSAKILTFGVFFVSIIGNGANYLIAINKQTTLLLYVAISAVVNVTGAVILCKFGLNIEGIAISTCISAAMLCALIWLAVLRALKYKAIQQFKQLMLLFFPVFLYIIILIICLESLKSFLSEEYLRFSNSALISLSVYLIITMTIPPYKHWFKEIYNITKGFRASSVTINARK